ncbi:hypothetical protein VNO77_34132 [Canavalia gladiata]|uniref:Uncharacterized protein n=1 Tax=Canavalia gladiata TaxID=3824 RepID=A0AAN9PYA8_CANGL
MEKILIMIVEQFIVQTNSSSPALILNADSTKLNGNQKHSPSRNCRHGVGIARFEALAARKALKASLHSLLLGTAKVLRRHFSPQSHKWRRSGRDCNLFSSVQNMLSKATTSPLPTSLHFGSSSHTTTPTKTKPSFDVPSYTHSSASMTCKTIFEIIMELAPNIG